MTGRQARCAELPGHVAEQGFELHVRVARDARVRGLARRVRAYEPLDHLAPEELRVVERVERDPEVRGRAAGVLPRLVGATAARRAVRGARGREAHPHAHDVLAALREERGGERRVDAAAHRDEDAIAHAVARTRASINARYRARADSGNDCRYK